MVWDEIPWNAVLLEGIGWDQMGHGMRRKEMRLNGMRRKQMGWNGMKRNEIGWDRMDWGAMG